MTAPLRKKQATHCTPAKEVIRHGSKEEGREGYIPEEEEEEVNSTRRSKTNGSQEKGGKTQAAQEEEITGAVGSPWRSTAIRITIRITIRIKGK
ncbi:MAG TPA: hypothetical protein VKW06_14660 [Candidatus Angelobacter sp.]|nr:hypothetical protein [Candidatus Angelobacter sp.]